MARPRPTRSRPRPNPTRALAPARRSTPRSRSPSVAAELVVPWRTDREVGRITREIHSLTQRTGVLVADNVVEMGTRLEHVRARIGPGQWLEWLADSVAFDRRTAHNYIALATWANAEPQESRRLRPLGPTKLYLILAVDPRRRRSLTLGRALPLPGGRRKTLESMRVDELATHLGLAVEPAPKLPIGKVVQGYRHRIAGLGALTTELAKRTHEIDRATARDLHDALAAVLAQLAEPSISDSPPVAHHRATASPRVIRSLP